MKEVGQYCYFEIDDRVVIVDSENEYYISLNSKSFNEKDLFIQDSVVSRALQKRREMGIIKRQSINTIYLFITDGCNLSCDFCCMRSDIKKVVNELPIDRINECVEKICKINPRKIIISGGEPLTSNNLVNILKRLRNNIKANISIQTNGTLLTIKSINAISKYIDSIEISTAHFNDLSKLECLISYCKGKNINVFLSFTYQKEQERLKHIIDLVAKYDIPFMLNFVNSTGSARTNQVNIASVDEKIQVYKNIAQYILDKNYENKDIAKIFFQQLIVRKSCNALGKMLAIYPDGNCYICHSLSHKHFQVGNIFYDDYDQILNSLESLCSKKEIKNLLEVNSDSICKACQYKYLCGGFCAVSKYEGDIDINECIIKKMLINYKLNIFSYKLSNQDNILNFVRLCNTFSEQQYMCAEKLNI